MQPKLSALRVEDLRTTNDAMARCIRLARLAAKSDVPIICATNVSLRDRLRQGKFREDLYNRLNGLTILIPALRDRREELPGLIAAELKALALRFGKEINAIHPAAMDRLMAHDWRGNLRELYHTVRTMTLFCDGNVIMPEHIHFPPDLNSAES